MTQKYEIDSLDLKIIEQLQKDARRPFLDIARKLLVSGGTIHQRVEKLKEAKIITGSKITVDYKKLGFGVTVLLGVHLKNAKDVTLVIEKLKSNTEVVETYYTTGSYALIIKLLIKDIDHFHKFLMNEIQSMEQIQSTESFICLDTPIQRHLKIE
jgi:Lrp/AsnC family transcriptional regulator, regulator for asnA, asnC and gidA